MAGLELVIHRPLDRVVVVSKVKLASVSVCEDREAGVVK